MNIKHAMISIFLLTIGVVSCADDTTESQKLMNEICIKERQLMELEQRITDLTNRVLSVEKGIQNKLDTVAQVAHNLKEEAAFKNVCSFLMGLGGLIILLKEIQNFLLPKYCNSNTSVELPKYLR